MEMVLWLLERQNNNVPLPDWWVIRLQEIMGSTVSDLL